MTITIRLPSALRAYAGQEPRATVQAASVSEALQRLVSLHPALKPHLFEDNGALRAFVNVYVGERDVRELQGGATPLRAGDTVLIVPSVAGG